MNLTPSDDQLGIAEMARQFLAAEMPLSRVREMHSLPEPIEPKLWSRCADLGWLSLSIPEEAGGVGLGLPGEVMLARELGRALTPGPFAGTAIAAQVCVAAGHGELAAALMSGATSVGLSVGDDRALDAAVGGLVLSAGGRGAGLRRVAELRGIDSMDPGVRLQQVTLGEVVAEVEDPFLFGRLLVWLAAELLGVLEAVRDMSAAYAKTREQFGRPIGVYQAVKHRCADMAVGAYTVQAQVYAAAVLVEARRPNALFHAASAHRLAVARARKAAADNIQNHGGIGYTWEHDAHLFLKRVEVLDHAAGPRQATWDVLMAPARHEFG